MSKWNRWKLIHKETGLTFNQFYRKYSVKDKDGVLHDYQRDKLIPVLLDSGMPAIYNTEKWYPYLFFLKNCEWIVEMK